MRLPQSSLIYARVQRALKNRLRASIGDKAMNTFGTRCTSIAFLISLAGVATADESPPKSFLGDWGSACDAWGVSAYCSSRWSEGLHSQHLIQEYKIVREEDGALIFAGRGVYHFEGSAVRGAWEGSNGAIHHIIGTFDDAALRVVWGNPETEIGRSEYSIENGQLHVSDFVLDASGWREFMTIVYEPDQK